MDPGCGITGSATISMYHHSQKSLSENPILGNTKYVATPNN